MTSQSEGVLGQLSAAGVAVWLDDFSRERLHTGNLADLIGDDHVTGVTSNPTIFASALAKGSAYDGQSHDLAIRHAGVDEAVRGITTYDIRWACDVLRPVYDETGHRDARVSLEVDPGKTLLECNVAGPVTVRAGPGGRRLGRRAALRARRLGGKRRIRRLRPHRPFARAEWRPPR
jgi:hypothetical protein